MRRNSILALCVGMSFFNFAHPEYSRIFSTRLKSSEPFVSAQETSKLPVLRFRIPAPSGAAIPITFSPDGGILAVKDKPAIKIFDVKSGELKADLLPTDQWKKDTPGRVYFSSDGKTLVVPAFATKRIRLWDTSNFQQKALLTDVDDFGFLDLSDRYLITKSEDNRSVQFWELSSGQLARTLSVPEPKDLINPWSGKITAAVFSPDGEVLVVASWSKIYFYDTESFALKKSLSRQASNASPVINLAFSPDNSTLALLGLSPLVALQDTTTHERRAWLEGHKGNVFSLKFSSDSRWIGTLSADKSMRLWDFATGQSKLILTEPKGDFLQFEFSPDSRWLATAPMKREAIDIWDLAILKLKTSLPGRGGSAFCFSPDGNSIAVPEKNGGVTVWDISNLR